MAPTFGPREGGGEGFSMHVACAHSLHSCGMSEHIWPSLQVGQAGVSGGHSTQRLKMARSVFSTSVRILVLFVCIPASCSSTNVPLLLNAMVAIAIASLVSHSTPDLFSLSPAPKPRVVSLQTAFPTTPMPPYASQSRSRTSYSAPRRAVHPNRLFRPSPKECQEQPQTSDTERMMSSNENRRDPRSSLECGAECTEVGQDETASWRLRRRCSRRPAIGCIPAFFVSPTHSTRQIWLGALRLLCEGMRTRPFVLYNCYGCFLLDPLPIAQEDGRSKSCSLARSASLRSRTVTLRQLLMVVGWEVTAPRSSFVHHRSHV